MFFFANRPRLASKVEGELLHSYSPASLAIPTADADGAEVKQTSAEKKEAFDVAALVCFICAICVISWTYLGLYLELTVERLAG